MQRQEANEKTRAKFVEESLRSKGFDRSQFLIKDRDYRRGNAVDNHFRGHAAELVLTAFDRCCFVCRKDSDLTFDHYAITKNEGGNFILYEVSSQIVRLNILVLCRACNSKKGESTPVDFLVPREREKLVAIHRRLLADLLSDARTREVLSKWYGIPPTKLPLL